MSISEQLHERVHLLLRHVTIYTYMKRERQRTQLFLALLYMYASAPETAYLNSSACTSSSSSYHPTRRYHKMRWALLAGCVQICSCSCFLSLSLSTSGLHTISCFSCLVLHGLLLLLLLLLGCSDMHIHIKRAVVCRDPGVDPKEGKRAKSKQKKRTRCRT